MAQHEDLDLVRGLGPGEQRDQATSRMTVRYISLSATGESSRSRVSEEAAGQQREPSFGHPHGRIVGVVVELLVRLAEQIQLSRVSPSRACARAVIARVNAVNRALPPRRGSPGPARPPASLRAPPPPCWGKPRSSHSETRRTPCAAT